MKRSSHFVQSSRNHYPIETLNYTISETVPWLSIDPASGASNGLTDSKTHTVNFTTADLPGGTYETVIQILSPEADNSPYEIPVILVILSESRYSLVRSGSTRST